MSAHNPAPAYIGLGANLGDPAATVTSAIERLASLGSVVRKSSLYRTAPWGVLDQPAFVNAVALVQTRLEPRELLEALQQIERDFGRVEGPRFGPRRLDLDILIYDDLRIDEPDLQIPHRRLFERAFVLVPLAEIEPAFARDEAALSDAERAEVVLLAEGKPGGVDWDEVTRRVREVAAACDAAGLARVRVVERGLEIEVRRSKHLPKPMPQGDEDAQPMESSPSPNGAVGIVREPVLLRSDVVGVVRFMHPSVNEGSVLSEEREIAYVESLGIRNPVSSGGSGRIVQVFVGDGQPVDYGQPLFAIERP